MKTWIALGVLVAFYIGLAVIYSIHTHRESNKHIYINSSHWLEVNTAKDGTNTYQECVKNTVPGQEVTSLCRVIHKNRYEEMVHQYINKIIETSEKTEPQAIPALEQLPDKEPSKWRLKSKGLMKSS